MRCVKLICQLKLSKGRGKSENIKWLPHKYLEVTLSVKQYILFFSDHWYYYIENCHLTSFFKIHHIFLITVVIKAVKATIILSVLSCILFCIFLLQDYCRGFAEEDKYKFQYRQISILVLVFHEASFLMYQAQNNSCKIFSCLQFNQNTNDTFWFDCVLQLTLSLWTREVWNILNCTSVKMFSLFKSQVTYFNWAEMRHPIIGWHNFLMFQRWMEIIRLRGGKIWTHGFFIHLF